MAGGDATFTSQPDDEGVLERTQRWYKEAVQASAKWREHAREDFAFCAGDQWDPSDKAALKANKRPCITYNRIGPIVDAVAGVEVNNRMEVKFLPRGMEDQGTSELL